MRKLFLGGDWGKRVTSLAHSIAKTLTRVRDPKPKPVLGKDVIVFIIIVLHLLFLFLLVCFESTFLNKIYVIYFVQAQSKTLNSIIETDIFTGTRTVRKCSKCKGPGHNRRNCTVWHVHVYHTDLNKHSGCLFKVGAYSRMGAFIENKKTKDNKFISLQPK